MSKLNRTVHAILGFLTWRPMSGYDIKQRVEESISNFWSESYGQIYPILKRLETEGLATKSSAATAGGRERHVYAITDAGRAELGRWLAEPPQPAPRRNELLLKLFFGSQTDRDTNLRHVERARDRSRELLEKYDAIQARLERDLADAADLPYWLMTLRYGMRQTQAQLAWCDETLAELRALATSDDRTAA